jgi:hypothetical protein
LAYYSGDYEEHCDERTVERGHRNSWRSERGRNSERGYRFPERGRCNVASEHGRGRGNIDQSKVGQPRVPNWKASNERESDYNMLETRGGHENSVEREQTTSVSKGKQLNTAKNQIPMRCSGGRTQSTRRGLKFREVKILPQQEMLKLQKKKETTNTVSSGNKNKEHLGRKNETFPRSNITGNDKKQSVSLSEGMQMDCSHNSTTKGSSEMTGEKTGMTVSGNDSDGIRLLVQGEKKSSESTQDSTSFTEKEYTKVTHTNEVHSNKHDEKKGDDSKISENEGSKAFSDGGPEVEIEHLKRLSALTLASNEEQG